MTYCCIRISENDITDFCWAGTYEEAQRYVLTMASQEINRKHTTTTQFYIRELSDKSFGYCLIKASIKLEAAYDER